jgi:hypothetical protein
MLVEPLADGDQWGPCMPSSGVGWQPSRFLADHAKAQRAFALAERLGSVNAAAQELGTTWPTLRKAFQRHGLGMPARNPEAGRQCAAATASRSGGPPAAPSLDPIFIALTLVSSPPGAARTPSRECGCAEPRRSRRSATAPWSS